MRIVFGSQAQRQKIARDIASVIHLPLLVRLFHHKARRTLVGFGIGVMIMLAGSTIAASVRGMEGCSHVTHVLVDAGGFLVHGIGAIPICKHFEPLWALVFGVAQEV